MTTLAAEVVGGKDIRGELSSKVEVASALDSGFLTRQNCMWRIFGYKINPSGETPIGMLIEQIGWHVWENLPREIRHSQQESHARGKPIRPYGEASDGKTAVELLRLYVILHENVALPANKFEAVALAREITGYADEHGKFHPGFWQSQAYPEVLESYPHERF
jgi:hypothetical protein